MSEYNPAEIEPKWQQYWEKNKTFKVHPISQDASKSKKQKLYCLDMFPYPSGDGLHIGHPLGYTATDIYSRFFRMKGYNVLHPMGFDAFGLPTEQHAVKVGQHPALIADKNCAVFRAQLKTLGYSYDWDREISTCTPQYYKWTQWIFLKLYNSWFDQQQQKSRPIEQLEIPKEIQAKGQQSIEDYRAGFRLAYYTEAMVNWCPGLGSVLANEEVINGLSERGGHPVFKKPMKQWMLRITSYAERLINELEGVDWPESIKEQQRNWIGKKHGAEIDFQIEGSTDKITAFTTRPDTLFGVTFFVLSPEHPMAKQLTSSENLKRVQAYCDEALKMSELQRTIENRKKTGVFTGGYVLNPISKERIPVYVGDYVLMSFGTGAVMGVPAHDERDFEFARTFNLHIRPVLAPAASNTDAKLDPEREKIRKATIEGEFAYTESGTMLPCDSLVARELAIAGKSNQQAMVLITDWLEKHNSGKRVVNYKLRDWLFSRQRYWGEPIPIVHWEDGSVSALSEDQLPLLLPALDDFKPSEDGQSPLAKAHDWLHVSCPKTGRKGHRETNTMPNWAGSCWYYLRFIDANNPAQAWSKAEEQGWMPVDLYVGGAEHAVLHLLYARFWHKVLYDLGYVSTKEPFQRLINQGMILANAFKNSRGALIPVDQVEESVDGTPKHKETGEQLERIAAKMSKSLRNVVNPDDIIREYGADTLRLYIMFMGPLEGTRMWDPKAITGTNRFLHRAYRFVVGEGAQSIRNTVDIESEDIVVRRAIHLTIKKVGEGISSLQFNTPIAAMMEFLNNTSGMAVSQDTLEKFTLILAPFAPHLAEELWNRIGHSDSVSLSKWPEYDPKLLEQSSVTVVIQVQGKKRSLVEVSLDVSEDALREAVTQKLASTEYKVTESSRLIIVYQQGTKVPRLVNVV